MTGVASDKDTEAGSFHESLSRVNALGYSIILYTCVDLDKVVVCSGVEWFSAC